MKTSILTLFALLFSFNSFSQQFLTNIKRHIDTLASEQYGGREPATFGDTLTVNYIVKELSQIDGITLLCNNGLQNVEFGSADKLIRSFNVVAKIKAPEKNNPKGENIIIGAHYDHVGKNSKGEINPGADDNASGVGYIIELARRYAAEKKNLKYDIIFIAFTAEEMGLKGSEYYSEHPLFPLSKTKVMINFDMLGRMSRNNEFTIRGIGGSNEATEILSGLNSDRLNISWEFRAKGPTDYTSFYVKGVPSLSFSTRTHKDYHTPADTPDKINYQGIEKADAYISQFIDEVLKPKVKISYKESVW